MKIMSDDPMIDFDADPVPAVATALAPLLEQATQYQSGEKGGRAEKVQLPPELLLEISPPVPEPVANTTLPSAEVATDAQGCEGAPVAVQLAPESTLL